MWNRKHSTTLSIVVCFMFVGILTAALFLGPWFVKFWFTVYRGWAENGTAMHNMSTLFASCFYPCALFAYVSLYSVLKLLFNIKKQEIFIEDNVKCLRRISWSCFAVSVITIVGGILYVPFLLVAVAAAFLGLMLRVVKNVMQNAVEISKENELTI